MWKILGIEPTDDESKITTAYRKQLMNTNPEEDVEGFKALRKAYEEALHYARSKPTRPIDLWINQLETLYQDYHSCISLENWQTLLSSPLYTNPATRGILEQSLLQFIENHSNLTQEVYIFLNEKFHFLDHLEELYDQYSEDFINNVICDGISYPDLLPAQYFTPGNNRNIIEVYTTIYHEAIHLEIGKRKELLTSLEALEEQHPYGKVLLLQEQVLNNKAELAQFEPFLNQHPDDFKILNTYIYCCFQLNELDLAQSKCEEYLLIDSKNISMNYSLAKIYTKKKNIKKAKELYDHLLVLSQNSDSDYNYFLEKRNEINNIYIQYLLSIPNKTQDQYLALSLAYYQNDRNKKAEKIFKYLDPDQLDCYEYYNLLSSIQSGNGEYEQSLQTIDHLIKLIENQAPQPMDQLTKLKEKRIDIEIQMEDYDRAKSSISQLLREDPENLTAYRSRCLIALYQKDFNSLKEYANQYIEKSPINYAAYLLLAIALHHLGDDLNSYKMNEKSLSLYAYDLRNYTLKASLLISHGDYQQSREILEIFTDENTTITQYYYIQGMLAEFELQNNEEAMKYYQLAIDQGDPVEDDYFGELFYRLIYTKETTLDLSIEESRKELLALCEKGLIYEPKHIDLLYYKAYLLVSLKRFQEALPILLDLQNQKEYFINIEKLLAWTYFQDLEQNADLCLNHCLNVLEKEELLEMIYLAGISEMHMGKLEDALFYIKKLEESSWQYESYFLQSQIHLEQNHPLQAIQYALLATKTSERDDFVRYSDHLVNIYLQNEQYDQAIDYVNQHIQDHTYPTCDLAFYKIYMQKGNYEELILLTKQLQKEGYQNSSSDLHLYQLYTISNHPKKAAFTLKIHGLFKKDQEYYDMLFLEQIAKLQYVEAIQSLHQLIRLSKDQEKLLSYYCYLGVCYELEGNQEQKKQYGNLVKEIVEEKMKIPFQRNRTFLKVCLGFSEALLGNFSSALNFLQQAELSTKCDQCHYGSCKDAYLAKGTTYLLLNDLDQALQLIQNGTFKWKDDYRFIILMKIIHSKLRM